MEMPTVYFYIFIYFIIPSKDGSKAGRTPKSIIAYVKDVPRARMSSNER